MRAVRSSKMLTASALLASLVVGTLIAGCNKDPETSPATNTVTNSANSAGGNMTTNSTENAPTNSTAPDANSATNATPPAAEPSGPKVDVITTTPGTGAGAKDGDLLSMRYTGRLSKGGKVFDSNVTKDPFNLVLGANSVIKGWEEGLQGVKVGEKRTLNIPSAKGYAERGAGEDIPPNSDLTFDIECIGIVAAKDQDRIAREALVPGNGPAVKEGQTVSFTFRGSVLGGKTFDETKAPLTVKLGSGTLDPVALEDAMVGMKVGGKYRLTMPPTVGFGPQGNRTGTVPGNSILVFEIEIKSAK